MIHIIRWLLILGGVAFLWWIRQPFPSVYRKYTRGSFT